MWAEAGQSETTVEGIDLTLQWKSKKCWKKQTSEKGR